MVTAHLPQVGCGQVPGRQPWAAVLWRGVRACLLQALLLIQIVLLLLLLVTLLLLLCML